MRLRHPLLRYAALAAALAAPVPAQAEQTTDSGLLDLSLEQLSSIRVTSVSKASQRLATAPAAIHVITREAIARSGASSLVEALRLAPNLRVIQYSSTSWGVSARGLGGANQDQNFANKLLVLIDGRSVYTPLFSGVYWQAQDLPLSEIERIEVISGPGATLWGANAVNGVVNVITRSSEETQGTRLEVAGGNALQRGEVRYGGVIGTSTTYRVYAQAFERDALQAVGGGSAGDDWGKAQGGFRVDWARGADRATVQGDLYRAVTSIPNSPDGSLGGGNVLARWTHSVASRSRIEAQVYFDQTQQFAPAGGLAFVLQTWDAQVQHTLDFEAGHQLVWGAGERLNRYGIRNSVPLFFEPNARQLTLGNAFVSGAWQLSPQLRLTLGLKLENEPYVGWQSLPDVRLAWSPNASTFAWAAVSRAVRSPTPFDRDVRERFGSRVFLIGGPDFQPEEVTAYQVGVRGDPTDSVTYSINTFYNRYRDLRSIEPAPGASPIPFRWGNEMRGATFGAELWATWQVSPDWQLSPGYQWLQKRLGFTAGSSGIVGVRQAGNDPEHIVTLQSRWAFGTRWDFGMNLRYVSALPAPKVDAYTELDAYLGLRLSPTLTLALRGQNLLHARHRENVIGQSEDIPRSGLLEARWQF